MNAKEMFEEWNQQRGIIASKRVMAKTYRTMTKGMASPKITDMPKSKSVMHDLMAENLVKAMELEAEADQLEKDLAYQQAETLEWIVQLKQEYQVLLIQRYYEHKEWKEIADSMFYTDRWVYKLHKKALVELEKVKRVQ